MPEYNYLTKEQREFFLEHGWLRIPNGECSAPCPLARTSCVSSRRAHPSYPSRVAIDKKILDKWMSDFWVRLGWDEHDKSTWKLDYLKMYVMR